MLLIPTIVRTDYTWLIIHSYYKVINPGDWKPEEMVRSYRSRVVKVKIQDLRSNFYAIRITSLWNNLSEEVVGVPNDKSFRGRFNPFPLFVESKA